jgi:hypothetical protein
MHNIQLSAVAPYVEYRKPFTASRLCGKWVATMDMQRVIHDEVLVEIRSTRCYVVYTHETYPLFVYDEQAAHWFGNTETINPLSARHQARCRPQGYSVTLYDTPVLQRIITCGFAQLARDKLQGKRPAHMWRDELHDLISRASQTPFIHSATMTGRMSSSQPNPQFPRRGGKK